MLLEKMVEEDPPSEEPEQEEGALSPVKSTNMAHLQTQVFEMRAEITTISEQMKLVLKALGYPYNISKSALQSVGAPHAWPPQSKAP